MVFNNIEGFDNIAKFSQENRLDFIFQMTKFLLFCPTTLALTIPSRMCREGMDKSFTDALPKTSALSITLKKHKTFYDGYEDLCIVTGIELLVFAANKMRLFSCKAKNYLLSTPIPSV